MRRFALLAAALLLACTPKLQYPECKTDPDCADHGQVCAGGFCKECREDADCASRPGKPVCRDALCTARPQCAQAGDCPAGQKCAQEKCVPECAVETAAKDCGEGKKCLSGRCAAQEECLADADCGQGRACVNKLCAAQGGVLASRGAERLGDCEVRAVYFGFDEATLSAEARRALDDDFLCMQRSPARRVVLSGHTDERGTTEYNLALGMRRADAVKKYLAGLGASPRQLKAISYGKERPADPGHDEQAWAKNRRVQVSPEP
jgi:peptidoglycan-associated lipoprotein